MKSLWNTVAGMLQIAAWLALLFIFWGDPDLWDKWHAHAVGESCSQTSVE